MGILENIVGGLASGGMKGTQGQWAGKQANSHLNDLNDSWEDNKDNLINLRAGNPKEEMYSPIKVGTSFRVTHGVKTPDRDQSPVKAERAAKRAASNIQTRHADFPNQVFSPNLDPRKSIGNYIRPQKMQDVEIKNPSVPGKTLIGGLVKKEGFRIKRQEEESFSPSPPTRERKVRT
jgi:hypothetical protein